MIDHDVEIETEQLAEAMRKVEAVLHVVGDVPSVLEAQERLTEAGAAITDGESFEDRLTNALPNVQRAEECVVGYGDHLARQHQQGRVRVSNEEWDYVARSLVEGADACNRWIDYAQRELRDIS